MMDEMTQNVLLDAVYTCPYPQIQDYFHQLMLEKDNIFLALAIERTFSKFKEVLLEQLGQNYEVQYILNSVPVVRSNAQNINLCKERT